ncbi:MAG TPA: dihydrodipicolinate synthase family protein [Saprospiraceae bacterium]|nr:dihydrodipicolinate synthase family protein [Saprospiraceae bacterium]
MNEHIISHFPTGVITASLTPMDRYLNADFALLVNHCQSLLRLGSDGIVLLGSTGEANSFSIDERKAILEATLHGGIAAEALMVGTGCCAITDTIELTTHAVKLGVHNVLMLPPFYYKPLSDDVLFSYYARVIERTGDDDLRIYLYHIPKNTGIELSRNLISRLLKYYPHIVTGIKDSGGDWIHMQALMKEFPSFRLYSGTEEYLLETLKAGGAGCISATANITVSVASSVTRAYRNGEYADDQQKLLIALRNVFSGFPFVGALKGFLAVESSNPSWNYLRPPNASLDAEVVSTLKEKFNQLLSPAVF